MENPTIADPTLTDIFMLASPPDEFEGEFDSYEDEDEDDDDDDDYEDVPLTGDFDLGGNTEPAGKDADDDDDDIEDVDSYDDNDDHGDFDDDDGDLF